MLRKEDVYQIQALGADRIEIHDNHTHFIVCVGVGCGAFALCVARGRGSSIKKYKTLASAYADSIEALRLCPIDRRPDSITIKPF